MDRKLQMMDAGMALLETEKPFGIVLGGLKAEMQNYGKVFTDKGFDLFLDMSTPIRARCISCTLQDAGECGETAEGEPVRRYAVSFKEGNAPTPLMKALACVVAAVLLIAGFTGGFGIPRFLTGLAGIAAALLCSYLMLKPSTRAQKTVFALLDTVKEGK